MRSSWAFLGLFSSHHTDDALKDRSANLLRPKRNCTFALPHHVSYLATDLETLVKPKLQTITEDTPLWLEEW